MPFFVTDSVHLQNTQLDRHALSYCVSLIENGVNPEALAVSVYQIKESMGGADAFCRKWSLTFVLRMSGMMLREYSECGHRLENACW